MKILQGTLVQESQLQTHEAYDPDTLKNDIAIVHLLASVPLRANVQIIALPSRLQTNTLMVGEPAVASGWGRTSDESQEVSPVLRYVSLPITPNQICQLTFGQFVTPSNVCVSGAKGRGTW